MLRKVEPLLEAIEGYPQKGAFAAQGGLPVTQGPAADPAKRAPGGLGPRWTSLVLLWRRYEGIGNERINNRKMMIVQMKKFSIGGLWVVRRFEAWAPGRSWIAVKPELDPRRAYGGMPESAD